MAVELTWIGHASFRIGSSRTVYIDPWKISDAPHDGDLIIISHDHYDHCSPADVAAVRRNDAEILGPPGAVEKLGGGQAALPGQKLELAGVEVETIPAYNQQKAFHPRANNWLGVVVAMEGVRIYYAGDTDLIDQMSDLRDIDVALLPVGGTYTMDAAEAAEACRRIRPTLAVPYHWGDIVGTGSDAKTFAKAAACKVQIIQPGESITLD